MSRMKWFAAVLVAVTALVASAAAALTASAAPATNVNVSPFGCQSFHGGLQTVPAGSTITIRQGVSEQTLGILTAYLEAQTTTISFNGTTVDVSNAWAAPVKSPLQDWTTFISYPTGITLGAGDSLTLVWVTKLAHVVPEVFNPAAGGPSGQPAFNTTDPMTFTCTVTAV